jgi:hypothetical protein
MTTRIALSELSRKGVRYRALTDGRFFLTATVRIPAGRAIAANNFVDVVTLAPFTDLLNFTVQSNTALEDSGTALTVQPRAYDAATAVPTSHTTGQDSLNLIPDASLAFRSGAGGVLVANFTKAGITAGANGAGTFCWVPATNGAQPDGNFTTTPITPRAYPLTGATNIRGAYPLTAPTGSRLIRILFPAAPGVQTVAAGTNRLLTVTLECAPARVNQPVQVPYDYEVARSGHGLVSP